MADVQRVAGHILDRFARSEPETPVLSFIRQERSACVRAALDCLPERQQTAIILQQYCQRSYIDIAGQMQLTSHMVKRLLERARHQLELILHSEIIVN